MAPGQADTDTPDELIGKVLNGRFRVVARIGAGGMGRVYKAVQEPIDRMVALKVLNPRYDGQKDPGFERRFFLEASMTAKLKHPNTITVHDYGRTDDGVYYIAMELLEGETLQSVLRRGPIAWPRALSIGSQIARSLREAHKQGMVHRDLKPANVMVLSEGTGGDVVKVLDFGLVKSMLAEKKPKTDDLSELTQAGILLGSPTYMAPEQARSDADGRTDIYALGIVLFQCITGRPPFQGKDSIDILVKQVREKPPVLKSLVPSVPDEVNALVMRCLEKAPDARFQSMDEVLEAMRVALSVSDPAVSGPFLDPRITQDELHQTSLPLIDPLSVEISDAKSRQTERLSSNRSKLVGALVAALVLAVGAGFVAVRRAMPGPASMPVTVVSSRVTFEVDSQPPGAHVLLEGTELGVTPFEYTVDRLADDVARAELSFTLDGYDDQTVVAQGSDGVVPVRALLKKRPVPVEPVPEATDPVVPLTVPGPSAKPVKKPAPVKPPQPPPGYKGDPYQ